MLGKPCILSLFLNKFNSMKHEHSCKILYFKYWPRREKTCLGVSDKASFKPVSSATETSWKIEVGSLPTVLSKKRITKALIRLRGCAGWSGPVLFAFLRRQVFSR